MKRAIILFTCALSGFSIILTAILIHFEVYWEFSENARREVAVESRYIGRGVEIAGAGYLRSMPAGDVSNRVTLISKDGSVLFDSGGDADLMENHIGRPEVASAVESGFGESTRYSETMRKQTYYYATRLNNGDILRVASTSDTVFASFARLIPLTLGIVAAVMFAAAMIGSRMAGRIVAPLNKLDLENPEDNLVYKELSPMLARIKRQNVTIAEQMDEMRKKQLEFSAITENMREGLLVLDKESNVVSCNKSALFLLRADFTAPRNILALRRDEPFRRTAERTLSGAPSETTFTVDGRHLLIIGNPVTDNGEVQGAVLMLMDVTEREDRERLRREFSANVSHELKTPLTSISGYAEILSNGVAKPEDAPLFAKNIYDGAQRLIALINDIMLLSKLDEGTGEFQTERVELCLLVRKTAERILGAADARNISVTFDCENAEIAGIPHILDEMVFNLLDNAVKYNFDGGSIKITARKHDNTVELAVTDTGTGIAEADRERIFERFYRAEKSRGKKVEGTGLGLSIVKHGAALHNAKIEAHSDGKSGARFVLTFPAAQ
ncbi:MAG: PAS domain-containing protein [Synergistaceae bacterium]|jgi:two-component system phosphate regulon sensor histidine kinase PhoR|nr:PAS domain-containing protein [Synergistaceae bacterium]